jgi:hypothetical protein
VVAWDTFWLLVHEVGSRLRRDGEALLFVQLFSRHANGTILDLILVLRLLVRYDPAAHLSISVTDSYLTEQH